MLHPASSRDPDTSLSVWSLGVAEEIWLLLFRGKVSRAETHTLNSHILGLADIREVHLPQFPKSTIAATEDRVDETLPSGPTSHPVVPHAGNSKVR